jgi:hypothetical protein
MRRSRPEFGPNYGISAEDEGMLPWSWADERLGAARNYWIVTAGTDREPSAAPVWGVWGRRRPLQHQPALPQGAEPG